MIGLQQRRRGPEGYSDEQSHLRWPSDVTEEQKQEWKAQWVMSNQRPSMELEDLKPEDLVISEIGGRSSGFFCRLPPTGISVLHNPTGLSATAEGGATQYANREHALALLNEKIRAYQAVAGGVNRLESDRTICRKITLIVRGDTHLDVEEAFEDALDLLRNGTTRGSNLGKDSEFFFENLPEFPLAADPQDDE